MALLETGRHIGVSITPERTWLDAENNSTECRNIFNGAFIPSQEKGAYYYLGRLRKEDTGKLDWSKVDQTDMGYIKVRMVNGRLVEDREYGRKVLFEAAEGKEDPRIAVKDDGTIVCGFTQVVEIDGKKVPYGAAMNLVEIGGKLIASPMRVYAEFGPGKNMTPTKDGFMFRQESERSGDVNNHKLLVATTNEAGDVIHSHKMSFKDCIGGIPDWAEFKMGTTGGIVSETIGEKTILIHGMKKSLVLIDGKLQDFYHYSIGAAQLVIASDEYRVKHISRKPLICNSDIDGTERSDQRYVIYACDILHTEHGIIVAVNKGDDKTVFVYKTYEEIEASLQYDTSNELPERVR